MNLIQQLKQEHEEIGQLFGAVNSEISEETPDGASLINELKGLKTTLVTHLDLEDKLLYPALSKSGNAEAKKLGLTFSKEMMEISKVAMAFFEKYSQETVENLIKSVAFKKELAAIIQAVVKRVSAEEHMLFPAYERYVETRQK